MSMIEGERLLLVSQKLFQKALPPEKRVTLQKIEVLVYKFSLERRGAGTVSRAYQPAIPRFDSAAQVEQGSEIQGKRLWGWAGRRLPHYEIGKEGRTGSHSGQSVEACENCFLKVVEDFAGVPILPHPSTQYTLQNAADESTKQLASGHPGQ
jgi:hypothetical protein